MSTAEEVWREVLAHFAPPERLDTAQFAEKYRFLSNEGGGFVGRWSNTIVPYLIEPMRCLTSLDFLTVTISGPGQCGKTEIAQNWLARCCKMDPGNFLWYMQTDDGIQAFVKKRINEMIERHDFMHEAQGKRKSDESIHYKKFSLLSVEFLSATHSNLINKSAPRIVIDEVDAYPQNIGDIKGLIDVRRQTFGFESMVLAMSHPDLARGIDPERDWTAGIMSMYGDSDRRVWYWPCPQCECWSSPVPWAEHVMTLDYPNDPDITLAEIEEKARLICPHNGCIVEDSQRQAMNSRGVWVGRGQTISKEGVVDGTLQKSSTAGFAIVGAMSPFILGGIGGLARARVKAEREFEITGDENAEASVRQVMVKQWGIPYTPPRSFGSVTANDLADRAEKELKLRVVPEGVRFMTAMVDVQNNRFDCLVRGWGAYNESWIIDWFRVTEEAGSVQPFNPATNERDWDRLLNELLLKAYPLADNSGRAMKIEVISYDTGGAPGVSRQALDFWRRMRRLENSSVVKFGLIDGRESWSLFPMKGLSTVNAPKLTVVYPDTSRRAERGASAGDVPMAMFNPNLWKDELAGQLQQSVGRPGSVHYPHQLRSKLPPHAFFEQMVAEARDRKGQWEKINRGMRNEVLDLMVGTNVAAALRGLYKINWEKPPGWAQPWETNSRLIPLETLVANLKDRPDNKAPVSLGPRIIEPEKPKSRADKFIL